MNREIKFRANLGGNSFVIFNIGKTWTEDALRVYNNICLNETAIEWYIEQKDHFDNYIFESDIIECVEDNDVMTGIVIHTSAGYCIKVLSSIIFPKDYISFISGKVKVIGNIHSNPELL